MSGRIRVAALLLAVLALAGCSRATLDTAPVDTATRDRIESFLASQTPAASRPQQDGAKVLRTLLFEPAGTADAPSGPTDASGGSGGSSGSRYVYGDVLEQYWILNLSDGAVTGVSEGSGVAYPARVLLREVDGTLKPVAVDAPKLATYAEDYERLFPRSVRSRLDGERRTKLYARIVREVRTWVEPQLAPDRLAALEPPADPSDPHTHPEPIYERLLFAPRFAGITITPISGRPAEEKDWEFAGGSPSGSYRAYYDLTGSFGLIIERVSDGRLSGVSAGSGYGQMFPASWKDGRTLVVDRVDVSTDPIRSVTHIEIDAETLQVLRAVPLGPLGFGGPLPVH